MSFIPQSTREFLCITTVGLSQEFIQSNYSLSSNISSESNATTPKPFHLPLDACWAHVVDEAEDHNVVYEGNQTACILNLPEDLREVLLQGMMSRFSTSPIDCHIFYEAFERGDYTLAMLLTSLLIFSMLCLLLTIVIYALKRELLTVPGMNLASLCVSHFVHYLTGLLNLFNYPHYQVSQVVCTLFGFTRNFTILATFFWLNVMAFDIWRTIAGMEPSAPAKRKVFKWRRYLKYSLYAWGMSLTIACTAVLFDNISAIPEDLRPSFRRPYLGDPDIRCTMSGNHLGSLFLFNTGPRILVSIANIVFFVLTARVIYSTGKQTDSMRTTNPQKDRFRLYLKLFVVMGLAWIVNIVEYLVHLNYGIDWVHKSPEWFRVLIDYFTAFIGVAIFITFGLMPTVGLIKQKLVRLRAPLRPGSTSDNESVRSSFTNSTIMPLHTSVHNHHYHNSTSSAGRTPPPREAVNHSKRQPRNSSNGFLA